nr:tetratricopeptide repeat protein [Bacteroidota bacterium]
MMDGRFLQSILIAVSFFFFVSVSAQNNPKVDSLIQQLTTLPEDVAKVESLLNIAKLSFGNENHNSIAYAHDAELLSVSVHDTAALINSLLLQVRMYSQLGKPDSALVKIKSSLNLVEGNNRFPRLAAKTNFYAGNIYSDIGDFNNTAKYFLKALAYFEKTGDDKTVAGLLNNLGNLYLGQNDNDRAIEYFEKSLSK